MKKAIILQLGVLLLLGHTLASAQPPQPQITGSTPFEQRDDISGPVMHLRVNGQFTGTFVLDTGTSSPFVSEAFVKRIGAKQIAISVKDQPNTFKGKPINSVTLSSIDIGAMEVDDIKCPVLPERQFASIYGKNLDGVMCIAFVRDFATLVDYGSHTITIMSPGSLTPADLASLGMADASSVHARFDPQDYVIKVIARLNETLDEEMAIETRSDYTAISTTAARDLNLKPKGSGTRIAMMAGIVKAEDSSLTTLRVGDVVWRDLPIFYASTPKTTLDPCIGANLVSRATILFDLPANKLYIKPAQPPIKLPPPKQPQETPIKP